ncbi:UNKNOWN [Stylonychia lemnae]|uniref:Uncharacterized protein n=1 Tax=Stylonychia lemnae TaxID=5949 RepID=A0A078B1K3_STYLE|nr:UNKNOWN [Stylonychia lemnae]|eukprot:CDW87212.1 UNKNOWN [Stylonychia lemnae]
MIRLTPRNNRDKRTIRMSDMLADLTHIPAELQNENNITNTNTETKSTDDITPIKQPQNNEEQQNQIPMHSEFVFDYENYLQNTVALNPIQLTEVQTPIVAQIPPLQLKQNAQSKSKKKKPQKQQDPQNEANIANNNQPAGCSRKSKELQKKQQSEEQIQNQKDKKVKKKAQAKKKKQSASNGPSEGKTLADMTFQNPTVSAAKHMCRQLLLDELKQIMQRDNNGLLDLNFQQVQQTQRKDLFLDNFYDQNEVEAGIEQSESFKKIQDMIIQQTQKFMRTDSTGTSAAPYQSLRSDNEKGIRTLKIFGIGET